MCPFRKTRVWVGESWSGTFQGLELLIGWWDSQGSTEVALDEEEGWIWKRC